MSEAKITLPWPPTVNHYHQPVKRGRSVRIIKGSKARKYESDVLYLMIDSGQFNLNLSGKLSIKMTLNPPTLAKYDIDNRTKAVFDSLTAAKVWEDDEQVYSLLIEKGEKVEGGNVEIIIDSLDKL